MSDQDLEKRIANIERRQLHIMQTLNNLDGVLRPILKREPIDVNLAFALKRRMEQVWSLLVELAETTDPLSQGEFRLEPKKPESGDE